MRSLAAVPLLLLAACGTETVAPMADADEVVAYSMVLEDPGHGPELCLGGVEESYPPQCGSVPITNWDWADVPGEESAHGTTWGEYRVIGTYDGGSFTVTRPVTTDEPPRVAEPSRLGTPCPEPDGGWRVLDPARTTDETLNAMFAAANKLPGYNAAWLDQSRNPAEPDDPDFEQRANDPLLLTANIALTTGLEEAERQLREIWGGALCVSKARFTERELSRIQQEVNDLPGMLSSGSGDGRDRVTLGVVYDDGTLQRQLDAKYGEGVVEVYSALQPYVP